MTNEEREEYREIQDTLIGQWDDCGRFIGFTYAHSTIEYIDWLNKKMFDYRGLIERFSKRSPRRNVRRKIVNTFQHLMTFRILEASNNKTR